MDSKYQVTYTRAEIQDQPIKETAYQESAASATEVDPYQFGKTSSINNREKKKWWTKFILTILSAILLGSLFGLLMINIFSHDQVEPVTQDPEVEPLVDNPDEDDEELNRIAGQTVELGSLSGYVIQAGAFQELEQAQLLQDMYLSEGYETVIWETDSDYRVFLAIYATEESAKQVGEQFKENDFDVYAREWESKQGLMTVIESEWLIEFQDLWQQSLSNHSESVEQAWREWANVDEEKLSSGLEHFYQQVAPIVMQFNQQKLPHTLLELLHIYDELIE